MTDAELSLWRAWEERRDEASFERLVQPHLRFLSDFARRAGCGADADDAVQTALVELAQARGDRPRRVPLRAWLGRSVLQQARMQRRAHARRARHEAAAARPERIEQKPSAHDEIERALSRLDPDARLAVELRYLHDLDYREIAHILKASEVACRIRVHRAIARLRKDLGRLAPALIAALPLLGGAADARAALARNATARGGTLLGGGLLMATKLKVLAVVLLALAALLLWRHASSDGRSPARAAADRRVPVEPGAEDQASLPEAASAAPRSEGAPGAADDEEPPLTPGNGCVRGVIRFEDGEPLRGARVSLWGESKIYATTDDGGRFHLHDDWVAKRSIYLSGPNGVRGPEPFGFLLGPDVKMVAGETVRVEIVLARGQRVAARVVSSVTGDAVAGAEISLRRWDGDSLAVDAQGCYGFTRTDAAGRFAFEHVVPAEYAISIAAKGCEAQHAHFDFRERPPPDLFRMDLARRLEIRVENAPAAAVGTEVRWCIDRSPEMLSKDGTPTYRKEYFSLDGVALMQEGGLLVGDAPPPGRYDITIWPTDHMAQILREKIDLGSASVEALTVRLAPGSRVEGTVRWPDGSPVPRAHVLADGLVAETDEEGRYMFECMPGAVAGASKRFAVSVEGTRLLLGERTFGPREPRIVDLTLAGTGSIRFGLAGGEAALDGVIEVYRIPEQEPLVEKRFRLPLEEPVVLLGLPPDPLRVRVWQFGRSWIVRDIRVTGEALDLGILELPAWPRPEIRVRVAAGAGLPPWIRVSQEDPDAPDVSELVHLDKEGRGVLPSLPPGRRRISVRGPAGMPVDVEIDVDPSRPLAVEVTLVPSTPLDGSK